MPHEAMTCVTIEVDALKRLMTAARLSGSSSPQAAENAAAAALAPWRTPTNHPEGVVFTAEAAQQISAAALQGLSSVPDCDEAWRTQVVSDLRHVADACRFRTGGKLPVREAEPS